MSDLKRAKFDLAWQQLRYLNLMYARFVTAGELAREMKISRNTAQKYLREMVELYTVTWKAQYGKNKQTMIVYEFIQPEEIK